MGEEGLIFLLPADFIQPESQLCISCKVVYSRSYDHYDRCRYFGVALGFFRFLLHTFLIIIIAIKKYCHEKSSSSSSLLPDIIIITIIIIIILHRHHYCHHHHTIHNVRTIIAIIRRNRCHSIIYLFINVSIKYHL